MTNEQIIECLRCEKNIEEDLHTFAKWKSLGFAVRKGEHGIETKLWKFVGKKDAPVVDDDLEDEETKKYHSNGFYLARSFLFKESQVDPIQVTV